jgi:hypothetical protein
MPEGQVVQLEDKEKAPLGPTGPLIPQTKEAHEFYDRRPPWLPGFELRAGYLYNARSFTNVGSELRLPRTGSHGAVLHGELYPFSFGKSLSPALAGLGVRVTAMLPTALTMNHSKRSGPSASRSGRPGRPIHAGSPITRRSRRRR